MKVHNARPSDCEEPNLIIKESMQESHSEISDLEVILQSCDSIKLIASDGENRLVSTNSNDSTMEEKFSCNLENHKLNKGNFFPPEKYFLDWEKCKNKLFPR